MILLMNLFYNSITVMLLVMMSYSKLTNYLILNNHSFQSCSDMKSNTMLPVGPEEVIINRKYVNNVKKEKVFNQNIKIYNYYMTE